MKAVSIHTLAIALALAVAATLAGQARAAGELVKFPESYTQGVLYATVVGGIAETQEVIDDGAARNIKADSALIRPEDINRAYERVVNTDVRSRFVIDLASMQSVAGAKS